MHLKLHVTHIVSPASVLIQLHEPIVVYLNHKTCVDYLSAGFSVLKYLVRWPLGIHPVMLAHFNALIYD
jgi:ribulose 1,5-bisphosphate carboxylase large subunit-like protein